MINNITMNAMLIKPKTGMINGDHYRNKQFDQKWKRRINLFSNFHTTNTESIWFQSVWSEYFWIL